MVWKEPVSEKEYKRRLRAANERVALLLEDNRPSSKEGSGGKHETPPTFVRRADLTLAYINRIFGCNAWYARDVVGGEVLWPEEWMSRMHATSPSSPWSYIIVEKDHFPLYDQARSRER